MKLIIDNSSEQFVFFYLKIGGRWLKDKRRFSSTPLTVLLDAAVKKHKKKIQDISGVAVLIGKGRFTATRIAVTVANTLSFALKIPVAGLNSLNSPDDFKAAENKLNKGRPGAYISAKYSAEAHISGKRSAI